ncbi:phenylalanine--tRNA ligase subunit beta [Planctellipticum variicoloris]|uniref:phenylalanine--tRNA ligase subunit beta n=1 Tax=Planctellipticum variicoloris TaxID=3064265 RepID=UPI0030134068|nr:phenylalanine--tRNA ligase subunit beta [Planctomycetaceae bacterium SH412]
MIISWDWLKQYVDLDLPLEDVTTRLTMSGLNLETTEPAGSDFAIDLEVTSNRPDCLGHLGIAREVAVLFGKTLKVPAAAPKTVAETAASATSVAIECPDLCPQYHARVLRGVKVGPSPAWLRQRLETVGIASVNNVVDVTNYVMLECGQPLHAFDFDRLDGKKIVVRRAQAGEKLQAIDHKEYALTPEMCVIADGKRPVAIAGVMGGATTEIESSTKNVLIEAAAFAPLTVRNTARKLNLHSPSSYRFERALDPAGPDWASRRCCELILEIAGGELLAGSVAVGQTVVAERPPIALRFAQFRRILGIEIPISEAASILESLGCRQVGPVGADTAEFAPPTFRRDLSREIDLIEEVARIHGYEQIPDDVLVPLCSSAKTRRDRVTDRVRDTLTAAGFFEAVTLSFVAAEQRALFTPHGDRPALEVVHSSRRHENLLRQSLVPSLLASRRENERHGVFHAQLFEVAKVYLAADSSKPETQNEPWTISLVGGQSYQELKGVVELLARRVAPHAAVRVRPSDVGQFVPGRGAEVLLDGELWGWLGELDRSAVSALDLRDSVCVAELNLHVLEARADLVPKAQPLPQFQAVTRDLNFVLDETVHWSDLEQVVRSAAGPLLETVAFGGQYRGKQIPEQKKSYVVTLGYRSHERTLTGDEVDAAQQAVIAACGQKLAATLRA